MKTGFGKLGVLYGLVLGFYAVTASGQCFGPACGPVSVPSEICFPQGCSTVVYHTVTSRAVINSVRIYLVAEAVVPGTQVSSDGTCVGPAPCVTEGFPTMGWSGPCNSTDLSTCPDIYNQAYSDMVTNAKRINRAYREAGLF